MNIENKVSVKICGKEYNLRTDESPEYLVALAARVEKEIYTLLKAKPNFSLQNAAVFVALTSLDESRKSTESIDNIRGQIKTYVEDAAKARAARDKLNTENKELKAKIAELEKQVKELKKNGSFDCEQLVLGDTIEPTVTVYAGALSPASDKTDTEPAAEGASSSSVRAADSKAVTEEKEVKADGTAEAAKPTADETASADDKGSQMDDVIPSPENSERNSRGRKRKRR